MNTHFSIATHIMAFIAYYEINRDQIESYEPNIKKYFNPTSSNIAISIQTHPNFVQRILRKLRDAGLVEIARGIDGGTYLKRSQEEINLYDIYNAVVESSNVLRLHTDTNPKCPIGSKMLPIMGNIVNKINNTVEDALNEQSLADVVKQFKI